MSDSPYCIVITTTDSPENAEKITEALIEEKLAACVQQVQIQSRYRWQNKCVDAKEIKLEIKSKSALFDAIKARIKQLHIYEVPEIVMVPCIAISESYAAWIDQETKSV